ncbi:MAG: SMI1/KNR4 family protein [Hymenobacter sp.]|nr:MAG: SMI1/KNR4 family protein [Hymenobacter sp.]
MNTNQAFSHSAQRLTLEEITQAETIMGVELPPQFKEFYLRYNGGVPVNAYVFDEGIEEFIGINLFSPLRYQLQNIKVDTIEQDYNDLTVRNIIPRIYLPFANDRGGNLFCLNLSTQQVVFILMDMGEFTEDCVSVIALSFDTFLAALVSEEEAEE